MQVSREQFKNAIEDIMETMLFVDKMNDLLDEYGSDGYIFPLTCENTVIDLLSIALDDSEDDTIGWFCYELDFGKKWKPGTLVVDGKDIKMETIDDLYDYLINK